MRSDSLMDAVSLSRSPLSRLRHSMHFSGYDGSLLSCLETAARSGRNPLILFKHSCIEALNCESYATPQTVSKHSIKHELDPGLHMVRWARSLACVCRLRSLVAAFRTSLSHRVMIWGNFPKAKKMGMRSGGVTPPSLSPPL